MQDYSQVSRRGFGAFVATALLAGCSAGEDRSKLRVADQGRSLQIALQASGEAERLRHISWSNFTGGPSIIAAATGNSIDLGWMAETPLVFAQAAGSPVKVVAVARAARDEGTNAGMAILVLPQSPIRTAADLKGRKIVYSPGTITHYFVLRALESVGLTLADVESITVAPGAAAPLLEAGKIDAIVTVEPLVSSLLVPGKARVLVAGGAPLTPELYFLVAPTDVLADPAKSAQIGDLVVRLGTAFAWWRDNPEEAALAAADLYRLPPAVAESVARRTARRIAPLTPDVVAAQQAEADAFHRIGLIGRKIDVASLFDRRFDAALAPFAKAA